MILDMMPLRDIFNGWLQVRQCPLHHRIPGDRLDQLGGGVSGWHWLIMDTNFLVSGAWLVMIGSGC